MHACMAARELTSFSRVDGSTVVDAGGWGGEGDVCHRSGM